MVAKKFSQDTCAVSTMKIICSILHFLRISWCLHRQSMPLCLSTNPVKWTHVGPAHQNLKYLQPGGEQTGQSKMCHSKILSIDGFHQRLILKIDYGIFTPSAICSFTVGLFCVCLCSYLKHVCSATDGQKAGGFQSELACGRAIQEAFSALFLQNARE